MSRKKVVTTVSIDPDVFQMGRDESYNFSQLLEEAIIERNEPEREIAFLNGQIQYHEKKILELKEKITIAEKAENKIKRFVIETMIEKYVDTYKEIGLLPDEVESRLCSRLSITSDELYEVFDEKL